MAEYDLNLPDSYRWVDGCHNCKHCIEEDMYEYVSRWCGITGDNPEPPDSFKERLGLRDNREEWHKCYKAWNDWADSRMVGENGICDLWEKRDGSDT